jgi:integrase
MRKWRNPFKLATANFIEVLSDKEVRDVSVEDATAFVDWWKDRVADGEVLADTANKNIGFMRSLIRAHDHKHMRGKRVNPFAEMKVVGGSKVSRKRREFSVEWIRDNLFCDDPLSGLNEEARDILIIMAGTGCSPSEISGILPHHIHLDAAIPYVELREEGRKLKNRHRVRDLVLVGPVLEAMKRHPEGFPRYRNTSVFSDTVNKFLGENHLLPTDDHTAYSLRHAFEGRMKRAKVDERDRAEMMGHSIKYHTGREEYGNRMTHAEMLDVLDQIAIPVAA